MPDDGEVVATVRRRGRRRSARATRPARATAGRATGSSTAVAVRSRSRAALSKWRRSASAVTWPTAAHRAAVLDAVDQRRGARHGRRVLGGRDVARGGTGRNLRLGTGRPVQRGAPQPGSTRPEPGESGQQGGRVGGVRARPKRADGAIVPGCADHRQPRERFIGQRHPPPAVREPGPAVVRRGVCGQQPQLAHTGLQRMGALDMVDARWPARPSPSCGRGDRRR